MVWWIDAEVATDLPDQFIDLLMTRGGCGSDDQPPKAAKDL